MKQEIEHLLSRYLRKETTAEEDRLVEEWLEEQKITDHAWMQMSSSKKDEWLSELFTDINKTIAKSDRTAGIISQKSNFLIIVSGIAATLAIIIGAYLFWHTNHLTGPGSKQISFTVKKDQTKMIQLPDGTRVWVNANSELRYPKTFDGSSREISLKGEAYFDVKPNRLKPFIIHTGNIQTTVLGTAFNIKEDHQLNTVEVTVKRGKVGVANKGKSLGILTRDQQLSVNLNTGINSQKKVNADEVIAWQSETLLFDDITLEEAVLKLQKKYKVKIWFENESLKKCRFSGSTGKGEKLEKILDIIAHFNHASWKRTSTGIIIYGKGCNR